MTREEQLIFCKRCHNRRMDMSVGLLCGVTGSKANFEQSCVSFHLDERVHAEMENADPSTLTEISGLNDQKVKLLRSEQNLTLGVIGSIVVGVLGAVAWAAITVATGWQIGYMALAIGAGVGFTMQYLGKGLDQYFGISGAIIAVLSCVLGNLLSVLAIISQMEEISYLDTLLYFDYSYTFPLLVESAQFMDLAFYAIAGVQGYKFAFRRFKTSEIDQLKRSA
jgi:hypothetical protein